MSRATAFYCEVMGAVPTFTSPRWSSLQIAGVRVGLFSNPEHEGGRVALHFAVSDLGAACAAVQRAGGKIVGPPAEVAPAVVVAEATDTEGNMFSLQQS